MASATIAPLSISFACGLLAAVSVWSWTSAILVGAVGSFAAIALRRSPIGRRWRGRAELESREYAAAELKGELAAQLTVAQREELARLEILVEHVRAQPGPIGSFHTGGAPSSLVSRLDALVVLYVDMAMELERSIAAFAATADDVPGGLETTPVRENHATRIPPFSRIAQLRLEARDRCRGRIARLRADLGGVGQVVRLVHEQTLAAGLSCDEVARVLGEILDEAELTRQAGEEVETLTRATAHTETFLGDTFLGEAFLGEADVTAIERVPPPHLPRSRPQRALPVAS